MQKLAYEMPPLVSAIVSAYNSERFIRGCLDDLQAQTIANRLEIIVVDSGSLQNEQAIVKEFQQRYNNLVYIRTAQRENVYAAWNRGIRAAQGKYVTTANTDDRHKNDAFERMAAVLEARPDIALVYANVYITETENVTFESHTSVGAYHWPNFDPLRLVYHCFMGPQPMWRKCMHEKYGEFDDSFECSGDWEFWLRMAETERFYHLDELLGLYLKSPASAGHRNRDLVRRENLRVFERFAHRAAPLKAAWPFSSATAAEAEPCTWFGDLQPGQILRIDGTPGKGNTFLAFEIIVQSAASPTVAQGIVQNVGHTQNTLRLLNREFVLPSGIIVKDSQDHITDRKLLKAGDRVTLWGTYSKPEGFVPSKIKINEPLAAFGIEVLQGHIDKIDSEKKILEINGFEVLANEKTAIGLMMRIHKK